MSFNRTLRCVKLCLLAAVCSVFLVSIYVIQTSDFGTSYYNYRKSLEGGPSVEIPSSVLENEPKVEWINYAHLEMEAKRLGPGEDGRKVVLYTQAEEKKALATIQEYSYNGAASDAVSLDRSLPDTRHELCKGLRYYKHLPSVSVIIVFHNEYLSFLLRTVHSILNRTPPQLLKEIILVDDFSSKDFLHKDLEDHVAKHQYDNVKIVRMEKRSGLMRARMAGIAAATGEIVVVMDAHIEVNTNWLPPLIEPIAENPRTATEPMVNAIHWNTLEYDRTINIGGLGGFDWTLDYDGYPRAFRKGQSPIDNYQNPVFLGAIMAINREYFWELGGYDDKLEIWGGEQYDISFKIWMCGGQILRVPCSQIGHNYKEGGYHPYFNTRKAYIRQNYGRIAEVWFDEYKEKYYNLTQRHNVTIGDISKQLEFRRQCKPFKWYIENIFPVMDIDFPINNLIKNLIFLAGTISFFIAVLLTYLIFIEIRTISYVRFRYQDDDKLLKV